MSQNFVPCAINLYKIRKAPGPERELFLSVQRQKDQYQGIWIVRPDGNVLAGHHDIKSHATWSQEVLATIDEGLNSFGPVTRRSVERIDPLPYRGQGVQADGRVTLAVYTRCMHNGRPDGPAVIDSIDVTANQLAQLFPQSPDEKSTRVANDASEWKISSELVRQFSRLLSPSSDQSTMPVPREVTAAEWKASVVRRDGDVWTVRYQGTLAAVHVSEGKTSRGQMTVRGEGQWDARAGRPLELLLVGDGEHRGAPPYDAPRQTGAVVRWTASDSDSP